MTELDQILYERLPTETENKIETNILTEPKLNIIEEPINIQDSPNLYTRGDSELVSTAPKKRDLKFSDKKMSNFNDLFQYYESCLSSEDIGVINEVDQSALFEELAKLPDFSTINEPLSLFEL